MLLSGRRRGPRATPCGPARPGRRPPGRPSCRRRPRPPPPRGTPAPRSASPRSTRPGLRTASHPSTPSRRYSAPVAISRHFGRRPPRRRPGAGPGTPSRTSGRRPGVGTGRPGPELAGLEDGPVGQLAPGDPGREAQVVLDPHAPPGLPAGGRPLQHDRAQPLATPRTRPPPARPARPRPRPGRTPSAPAAAGCRWRRPARGSTGSAEHQLPAARRRPACRPRSARTAGAGRLTSGSASRSSQVNSDPVLGQEVADPERVRCE